MHMWFQMAMDQFCQTPFWDWNKTWNSDTPDFTICFEKTVLVAIPCLLFWLLLPLDIFRLKNSKYRDIPWNIYSRLKLVVTILLIALNFFEFLRAVIVRDNPHAVDICMPFFKFLTFSALCILLVVNMKYGLRSSGVMFLTYLAFAVCGLPQFRTELRMIHEEEGIKNRMEIKIEFLLYFLYYPGVVIMLIANCYADPRPNFSENTVIENVCPEYHSSFISQLLFAWFDPLVFKGYMKPLENTDLWNLDYDITSKGVVAQFEKYWKGCVSTQGVPVVKLHRRNGEDGNEEERVQFLQNVKTKPVSCMPSLYRSFGIPFLTGCFFKVCQDVLTFVSPQILRLLIAFIGGKEPMWRGYVYTGILFTTAFMQTILLAQYFHFMYTIGLQIRTALISAIYKKSLRISNEARKEFTTGEIVNLMSVDAQRFTEICAYINMVWSGPLQIILALYFLYQILGPSVFAGLLVMLILIPINSVVANKIRNLQILQMKCKDQRVKLMNEILSGIKVLKLYAWEPSFESQVRDIRRKEINILKYQAYLNAATSFIWACAPFLVSLVTFGVYVMSDDKNVLDAETAFVSLSLFNILRFPLSMLPMFVSNLVQAIVSLSRINKFLNCPELDENAVSHDSNLKQALVIENGNFKWDKDAHSFSLRDINITVDEGSLVAVVGSVGCGKSSLISACLGEMNKVSGFVNTKGLIAYVPQQAWIQNASFRDNILFGKAMDDHLYNAIIQACALKPDLEVLAAGDRTEIGEKGINLSGGQKQRISLARAVYSNADLFFLDDPLSAVDSHVGKHIFEHVIGPKGILKNKTRILVTHGVTHLPSVDMIIVMKDGRISELGTYSQLQKKKGAFAEFLAMYSQDDNSDEKQDWLKGKGIDLVTTLNPKSPSRSREPSETETSEDVAINESVPGKSQLIETEFADTGNVKWEVYAYYLKSIGIFLTCTVIFLNVVFQSFSISSNIWLSVWSSDKSAVVNGTQDISKRNMYLTVYGILGIGQGVVEFFADITIRIGCWKACRMMHYNLLYGIMRVPMTFMDVTPLGRILSRFSKDVDVLDNTLPQELSDVVYCLGDVIATIFVISYSTPIFLIVIFPITILYAFVQRFYVATSRQLKRLESVSRSPIFSHFGETISGSSVIRAFGLQESFILESEKRVDFNQKSYYPNMVSNRWLAVRLETIGNMIILFSALFAVLGRDTTTAGLVGLSVTYALQITQTLNWVVRMTSEVETNVVAVERIKEYGSSKQEASWSSSVEISPSWPNVGEIIFENFKVRYRESLDLVLKGISITIQGGERVGIVGRTGAGKSSLTLGLFRIIEAAEGKIIIDGVDIATIGLHMLRSKLTIIPQDPILFSGTLRMNLDPAEEYSDENIWRALELAHLKNHVLTLTAKLQHEVTEGGDNFSVGQKQLVCLARALLRKTKILILDEATAAVDLETDDLIQATIRKEFKDCTVLTIAHRLNTIMDYDKIILLDGGLVKEYDKPSVLMINRNSAFYKMARDAGLA